MSFPIDPTTASDVICYTAPKLYPRRYQLEIFERAKHLNTLAFLPTASGKTLISVLLIAERLAMIRQKVSEGSRKQYIAFVAPTK